ncbi:MAG TPA: hypothetical protein VEA69_05970 [Tepidisphaeraceae bacterium]|nr:hypothetical protein [Tepidisphaeraceae bacterium]
MDAVRDLSPGIVDHARWAVSKWFYANPIWYYHRRGTDEELVASRKFYDLVDPGLRPLVKLLHDNGLHTTPSCEGHFYPKSRFEQIWAELTREAEQIRDDGLVVKDSETDKPYRFHDPIYTLPWPTFDAFYAQAGAHQGMGYLGVLLPCDCAAVADQLAELACDEPALHIGFDAENGKLLGRRLLGILARPGDVLERERVWADVTERFRRILDRYACPAPFTPSSDAELRTSA